MGHPYSKLRLLSFHTIIYILDIANALTGLLSEKWDEMPFVSCKKVMMDLGKLYRTSKLLSFRTISKALLNGFGCGLMWSLL